MRFDVIRIDLAVFGEIDQQAVVQRRVRAGAERQMQIGAVAGGRAARVNDQQAGAALGARLFNTPKQHRVTPGQIGADQHNDLGLLQILVAGANSIAAKGALMAGHGRGHAQTRIGVDIGAADKPFHEFIGHVVIFGEQLTGHIKGQRIGAVFANDSIEAVGHGGQGLVPADPDALDFGMQ